MIRYTVPFQGDPRVLHLTLNSAHQLLIQTEQEAHTLRKRLRQRLTRHAARIRKNSLAREQRRAASIVAAQLGSAIAHATTQLRESIAATEGELVAIALGVAEAVIGMGRTDAQATAARVQAELSKLRDTRGHRIRCNPDDHPTLSIELSALSNTILPDPTLTRGRVIVETSAGEVDLDPLHHLHELSVVLHESINSR